MSRHPRIGLAVATAMLGGLGMLGLTACGLAGGTGQAALNAAAAFSPEAQALAALGLDPADVAPGAAGSSGTVTVASTDTPTPSASPSKSAKDRDLLGKRRALREMVRNTLHGEVVVQTKDGTKTVLVQRGTVTAISDTSVTVKSSDGYTLTWTFGNPIHVIEHRTTVQPKDVAVGAQVGVAGTKNGNQAVAVLLTIPKAK
jgi:hypothetical protein